ncbi:MAG: glycosyltransferase family 4 protein [Methanobacteriaceae archaeon]|nr:glycosyltransferase family 4 protein [Methanobacteriaceae archaeon]
MKILIISPGGISNPTGGSSNRMYNLAFQLKENGNEILILEPNEKSKCDNIFNFFTYPLGRIGKKYLSMFVDLNPFFILKLFILISRKNIKIIQVELPWGVSSAKIICKLLKKDIKVVYNSQNFQSQLHKDIKNQYSLKTTFFKKILANLIYYYTKIIEKWAVQNSDLLISVSDEDKEIFTEINHIDPKKIEIIPNGTSLNKILKSESNKKVYGLDENKTTIVFHGSYKYPPNYEAISLIKDKIYPNFEKSLDKVEFIIAGQDVPLSNQTGLRFLGYVENIYELLKSSDIAIVPIINGGGTRLKVLDYLGSSLPIVTTKKGIEGIEANNYEDAIIVEDVNSSFINAMIYLIENKNERIRIGNNGRKLVENRYDWVTIGKKLNELYLMKK